MEEDELLDTEIQAATDAEFEPFVAHSEIVTDDLIEPENSNIESVPPNNEQTVTTCPPAGTCEPMDVNVSGSACSPKPYNGIYWDGTNCRGAYGCNCVGADCYNMFPNTYAGAKCCKEAYYYPCQ